MLHGCRANASGKALQLPDLGVPGVEVYKDGRMLPPHRVVAEHLAERTLAREGAPANQHARCRQIQIHGALPPLFQNRGAAQIVTHHYVRGVILLHRRPANLDLAAMPREDRGPRAAQQRVLLAGDQLGTEHLRTRRDRSPWPRKLLLGDQLHAGMLIIVHDDAQLAAGGQLLDPRRRGVQRNNSQGTTGRERRQALRRQGQGRACGRGHHGPC
mmetsp:Transcript_15370/g.33788  ORF Transcript_15370/g.33788 Transcript_15370/m.33788 type:complete len:214 (-) Transcript_15370:20-661(-)